jgi:hypothetical protein
MKYILLFLSGLSLLLLGCRRKKTSQKTTAEFPRFPETNNSNIAVKPVVLEKDFALVSFFIAPDKKNVYVLGARSSEHGKSQENGESRPGPPDYMDYRLYLLDAQGKIKKHLDMPHTDWMDRGSFGLLEGRLLLRVGDWFLVLDTQKWVIQEKIPVHDSRYIPWKETVMTRDEHQADYQKRFEALYKKTDARWLHWLAGGEYLVFVKGAPLNPGFKDKSDENARFEISDGVVKIREIEYLSGGTQLDYPNYKNRSVLQYEMLFGDRKINFSTTDIDRHDLHLDFSDNKMLTTEDGAAWVSFEGVLYRVIADSL